MDSQTINTRYRAVSVLEPLTAQIFTLLSVSDDSSTLNIDLFIPRCLRRDIAPTTFLYSEYFYGKTLRVCDIVFPF